MSDVKPVPAKTHHDKLYHAKGPQNDGGYRPARENEDDLFRSDDRGDSWKAISPAPITGPSPSPNVARHSASTNGDVSARITASNATDPASATTDPATAGALRPNVSESSPPTGETNATRTDIAPSNNPDS